MASKGPQQNQSAASKGLPSNTTLPSNVGQSQTTLANKDPKTNPLPQMPNTVDTKKGNQDSLTNVVHNQDQIPVQSTHFSEENIRKALLDDQSDTIAQELDGVLKRLSAKIENFNHDRELASKLAESLAVVAKERPNEPKVLLAEILKENL